MKTSTIPLDKITNMSDFDLMRVILSSGDYFPGFYRYTMGTLTLGDETLDFSTFMFLYMEQQIKGVTHHKEDWLQTQHEVYDRDIKSETARNFNNFPEVREMLNESMMKWYFDETEYDIFVMYNEKVSEIKSNITYYFMGSLIRHDGKKLYVGYNDFSRDAVLTLEVSESEFLQYINDSFKSEWVQDLFIPSEVVGTLSFDKENVGLIKMEESSMERYAKKAFDLKALAVPSKSRHLPIRFA